MKKRMKYLLMLIAFVLLMTGCNKSGKADETTAANTEDELKTVKDLGDSSFRKYLDGLKSDEVDESERIDAYQLTSGNVKLSDEETREYTYTAQASVTTAAGGDTISVTYQIRKISDGAFETVSMDFERGNAGTDPGQRLLTAAAAAVRPGRQRNRLQSASPYRKGIRWHRYLTSWKKTVYAAPRACLRCVTALITAITAW